MTLWIYVVATFMVFGVGLGWWIVAKQPLFKRYKEETLYGVIWRWVWRGRSVVGLWCYCPTCKGELSFDDENCRTTKNLNEKTTFFICKACNGEEKGRVVGGDRRYVMTLVQHELMRRASSPEFLTNFHPKHTL
ncbi:hypothetical protein JWV37_03215 [Sulfurospirillum sp. T05]|uniref:Uncharacterized protein n=1 Tax=Sulfurospirillum tamanense TaxID=2813362 RepID=A0ABS2WQJ0_9BACT|nr:hypothetical protein [Sulfurospirillum tamanensis]MBN2963780.1 hypothetical protein [Sulfurospirillum tamanensis]